MAEPTQSPALPSTADATPYVPVSWTAVASALTAALFAIVLLILGAFAFIGKKPLLMQELLVMPVIAIILCFAARRIIRNSEGTRTGEGLAVGAWWASLVLGLGYVAYLFAIDYSVRRDAANVVEQWVGQVRDDKIAGGAFYTALDPRQRQGVSRSDTSLIEMRFRDELLAFRNSDLVRLAQRNRGEGEFKFESVGVADWSYKPGAIDCAFSGTVTCPEGKFPILVKLKGIEGVTGGEGGGVRQWAVAFQPGGGFIQQEKSERTTYGWMMVLLEINGGTFGKRFIEELNAGPFALPFAYQGFVTESGTPADMMGSRNPTAVLASFIPLGVASSTGRGYARLLADTVFKLPGGAEPTPAQKDKFFAAWNAQGLFEAGRRLKDPAGGVPDKDITLKTTDTAVEVHLPVEIPLQNSFGKPETARGRVVVACKDPALLAEVKARKAAAVAGEKPVNTPPAELGKWTNSHWRVVRIESDLNPVTAHAAGGPGGGPPGMGGGHGGPGGG